MEKGPVRSDAYFPEWKPAFRCQKSCVDKINLALANRERQIYHSNDFDNNSLVLLRHVVVKGQGKEIAEIQVEALYK